MARLATKPLPSHGPPMEGDQIRSGYITHAFLGANCLVEWGVGEEEARVGNGKKKMPGARPVH